MYIFFMNCMRAFNNKMPHTPEFIKNIYKVMIYWIILELLILNLKTFINAEYITYIYIHIQI